MECLSRVVADPALSPSCPLGKAEKFSGRREHGTPDHAILPALAGRPSVQLPAGIERRARFIAGFRAKARPGYAQMKVEGTSWHRRKRTSPCLALAAQLAAVNIKEIFTLYLSPVDRP